MVLVARRVDRLDALAASLSDQGVDVRVHACDLTDPDARDRLAAALADQGRAVSVLCNAAGFGVPGHFAVAAGYDQIRLLRLNVEATVDLCRRFVPAMVARGTGPS